MNRKQAIKQVKDSQRRIDKLDAQLGNDIMQAYQQAREALIAQLVEAFTGLGDEPTPAQIRGLLTNVGLIHAIEKRIDELTKELTELVGRDLGQVTGTAYSAVSAELKLLATALGVEFFPMAIDPLLELTIAPAITQIAGLTSQLKATLTASLRGALASGQRMGEIVKELYGIGGSIWARGLNSARLAVHRAVAEAEKSGAADVPRRC